MSSSWSQDTYGDMSVGEIEVPLTQVRNLGHGELVIVIFEKVDRIEIEMDQAFQVTKSPATSQNMTVVFKNIPYGEYAVGIFHDLNKNGRLDTNFFGFPKEDMAVSNNAKDGPLGGPTWQASKIQLSQPRVVLSAVNLYPFGPATID